MMLGWRLRVAGKACRWGCCTWNGKIPAKRTTSNERARDKRAWRRGL